MLPLLCVRTILSIWCLAAGDNSDLNVLIIVKLTFDGATPQVCQLANRLWCALDNFHNMKYFS
jgi:hypothetical protein